MLRNFNLNDNGPFYVNANYDPDNRKLAATNLNSNIGVRSANSSCWTRHQGDTVSYTKIFQKSYDLVKWIYPTINKFPKSQRLILSQRIENTSIKILEMVIDLGYSDSKITRKKILFEIHKLQILMRLSKDLAFLDLKKYEYVSSLLKEISDLIDKRKWIGNENLQKFV